MAYQMDFFAGVESKVLAAIGDKVQYPAYIFVRDEEDSVTGRLAFVDQNNELKFIRGENKQHVVNVDVLPDISEGNVEVLYIMEGIVYVFDGVDYKPMYKDHTEELKSLDERITLLETKVEELEASDVSFSEQIEILKENVNNEVTEKFTTLEATDEELVNKIEELNNIINNLKSEYPPFVELE